MESQLFTARPKTRRAPIEARRLELPERPLGSERDLSFLLCPKDQAARFCPSFGTEPYVADFSWINVLEYSLRYQIVYVKVAEKVKSIFRCG
ncbi:hypothetical protein [Leptospira borgpetersenii]|uniref:hypothetical protein n=1 Tax=Leptospira borgpetersenii TaxID=174 RepID=UPI0005183AB3|nr:hypothetical protein [Leptospira borgpetersenii]